MGRSFQTAWKRRMAPAIPPRRTRDHGAPIKRRTSLFERRQTRSPERAGDLMTRAQTEEDGDIAGGGQQPILAGEHVHDSTCFTCQRRQRDVQSLGEWKKRH